MTKELLAVGTRVRHLITSAVLQCDGMNAICIYHNEALTSSYRITASVADVMPELDNQADLPECCLLKEYTVPFLRRSSALHTERCQGRERTSIRWNGRRE